MLSRGRIFIIFVETAAEIGVLDQVIPENSYLYFIGTRAQVKFCDFIENCFISRIVSLI